MIYPLSATSQSIDIQIVDDTGLPVTSLVAATFPTLTYSLAGANADVAFPALSDLASLTTAWAAGGVKERGNGVYRLDLPNGVFTTAGEVKIRGEATGKHVISPWIDVAVTVANVTNVTNLTNAPTAGDFTAAMKTSLDAATPAVTVSDKTGFSLSTAGIAAIWNALTSGMTTVGSVGKKLADWVLGADSKALLSSSETGGGLSSVATAASQTTIETAITALGTPAQAGDKMDLVDAPNATAITAIQSGLATSAEQTTIQHSVEADVVVDTSKTPYELVYLVRGTGGIGVGTELFRKKVYDDSGTGITDAVTVPGRLLQ